MSGTADLASLVREALNGRLTWHWAHGVAQETEPRADVTQITASTRGVVAGALFVCLVGRQHDGHDFAEAAVSAGAVALVTSRPLAVPVPQVVVADTRRALGFLCAARLGWPSKHLQVVGITGTNGKTSTAHLVGHLLRHAGRPTSVRGTLTGALTTPEAPELQQWLADRVQAGDRSVVMEVSSHALELERVAGTHFAMGVFTNLGHDHLDFHHTPERYFAAKAALFRPDRCAVGVVNRDDVHGRLLADAADIPMVTFGLDDVTDVHVDRHHHEYRWRGHRVRVPLGGDFHLMNSLASLTAAVTAGVDESTAVDALATVSPVPGRFQVIDQAGCPTVVVDFAHTPDGLEQVLTTARRLNRGGRLIVVFGCGGDRDAPKRPLMGAVAARLADAVILTSDNPRSEDPETIIGAIRQGADEVDPHRVIFVDPDRRRALAFAIAEAKQGDVIVVAGKGHESTQTVGDRVLPFDDVVVAHELLTAPRSAERTESAR